LRRLVGLWIALCLGAAAPGAADEGGGAPGSRLFEPGVPVQISADSLEYEAGRDLYVARGHVVIRQEQRQLSADWMTFSRVTRRGVASGDVVFTDGTDTVHTRFVEFDVDTLEGVMFDASFEGDRNRFELRGEEIAKTGEQTYRFRNGEFTTCRCPDPEAREPWQVKAEQADLEIEGYGTVRNTTFEVLGVPILWLPWMIYPLKTERQSGLLFPDLAVSGRNGWEVGLPIFWAVADPVNLIFTPRYLGKRGPKGDLGVEYVVGEHSGGDALGAYIYDRDVAPFSLRTPFGRHRWATLGSHDFSLPAGWRFQTRYAFAADNSYPNDFDDLARYRQDRFLDSRAFATRPWGPSDAFGFVAGADHADDLQNPDDTDRDDFVLDRLPEARVHALPQGLPFARWLVPALDVRYAWYQQQELPQRAYDDALLQTADFPFLDTGVDGLPTSADGLGVEQGRDGQGQATNPDPNFDNAATTPGGTEGDSVFQEGELLADSGQRVLLTPRLGVPFRLFDALEFYPEVGWHETLYESDAKGFERRGLLTGRMEVRTRFVRRFGETVHLLEPQLSWAYVQDVSQFGNPVYVPATAVPQQRLRELDLENLTRDWADRIGDQNLVKVGLGNRFYAPGPRGAARVIADFVLSAVYDIDGTEFGNLYLDGRSYPFRNSSLRFSLGFDPVRARLSEALLSSGWRDARGDRFTLGYRFIRNVPNVFEAFPRQNERFNDFRSEFDQVNQLDGGLRVAITRQWGITYRGAYSFERQIFLGNQGGVEYISKCGCWAVRVQVSESRSRGAQVSFEYTLLGLGDDTTAPFEAGGRRGPLGFLDGP